MCGIIGYFGGRSTTPLSAGQLENCRDTLMHRGPDMAGAFFDRGLFLGFRRLAILDCSPEGGQPMTSLGGRYTIVFNGEIYNFVELRVEMEANGEVFRGRSDTEVLLILFAKYGLEGLSRLNGMFAICIYDSLERNLTLVRDRLGVKPLYYWDNGTSFAFASEIRALKELPGFPQHLNQEALGLFFRLGFVPDWSCIYSQVFKLEPGCWLRYHLDSGRMDGPTSYWTLPQVMEDEGKSEDQWLDRIQELLWDATRLRLRSDVPIGVFLSGGIDSGLVAAAAADQMKGMSSLTMGFNGESEDETGLALRSATKLGLNFVHRNIDMSQGMRMLPSVMGHFDEPFSDTSALPTALVCAEARKEVTVVLSGDGGDEVFGGYLNHVRARRWRFMEQIPRKLRQEVGLFCSSLCPDDSMPRRFWKRVGQPVGRFGLGGMLYPFADWLKGCIKEEYILEPEYVVDRYNGILPQWTGATCIDQAQRTDIRSYMLEDILIKVDRMSMKNSLEVRSPFLDYRLVELGLSIPSRLRTKGGQNKYLLRKLAARHLPPEVTTAVKRGFGVPLRSWLTNKTQADFIRSTLVISDSEHPDPFRIGGGERLLQLSRKNSALDAALTSGLCYRWWAAKSAPTE